LAAAKAMAEQVDALSQRLAEELAAPLKNGIGIHCGPAVVGRMGYGSSVHLTAIGDTVNVASRLQDATKEFGCQLVISEQAVKQSGLNAERFARHELTVRNRREPLTVVAIDALQTIAGDG
jgi:adenylate cyclase